MAPPWSPVSGAKPYPHFTAQHLPQAEGVHSSRSQSWGMVGAAFIPRPSASNAKVLGHTKPLSTH